MFRYLIALIINQLSIKIETKLHIDSNKVIFISLMTLEEIVKY